MSEHCDQEVNLCRCCSASFQNSELVELVSSVSSAVSEYWNKQALMNYQSEDDNDKQQAAEVLHK